MSISEISSKRFKRQFVLLGSIANIAGALLTFLYFTYFDAIPGAAAHAQSRPFGGLALNFLIFCLVMVVVFIVGDRCIKRSFGGIYEWLDRLEKGASPSDVPADVLRAVLGFAPRNAIINFAMWSLAGICWFVIHMIGGRTFDYSIRGFFGLVAVGGILTTALLYFVLEHIWRPLVPLFFPEGGLRTVGAIRVSVMSRLLTVFLLVGLWPSALLVKLSLERAYAIEGAADPEAILHNLLAVELSVLIVGSLVSAGLAIFMTRGLTRALHMLQAGMRRVEQNDMGVRVPVTSNDELGNLAEGFNAMTAGLRRGELFRNLLNLYVTPEVARAAVEHGTSLGGTLTECTMLFSDIRGFTGLSERLPPDKLIALLNRYMEAMVAVISRNGGMVNKFGGDSMLAAFGTPLNPSQDHAACAVRAAMEMRHALAKFNMAQAGEGGFTLQIGIGIATGTVVAGNVGGKERIEYTVIGDAVNLASRLQAMTRKLDADTLISAKTYEDAGKTVAFKADFLPPVSVRGKKEPVAVYALRDGA